MPAAELLRFAWGALAGHRLRSLLSLAGVAIGVTAVIVLTALGEGGRRYVVEEFASIGTNLLVVLPGHTETTGAVPGMIGVPNDLSLADTEALRRGLREARRVAPLAMGTETVSFEERQRQVAVLGTSRDYRAMLNLELARGSFLPAEELGRGAPLAVLGSTVARELFGNRDPVGAAVRIGDWRLRVIGVMAPMGTRIGVDFDQVVFVPVATGLRIFNKSSLFRILVETHAFSDLETARGHVGVLLVERHGEEDFTIFTEEALVSTFTTIFQAMTLALAAIAAISLTVAGIGIMNVMLVSVSERTREIGLLRAVGVGRGQIVAVFLTEAVLLAGAGGLAGLACGWALVRLLVELYPALPASPPVWAVVSAVAVSLLVGAVFGLLPARRAARLDPVLALGRK